MTPWNKLYTKMKKNKKTRNINYEAFTSELEKMITGHAAHLKRHNKIAVAGEEFEAYETRVVNKHFNNKGAGNYRVLLNQQGVALAEHTNKGAYRIVFR